MGRLGVTAPSMLKRLCSISSLKISECLRHSQSPLALVPCSGEYNPVLSTRQQYETLKLNFVDVLLEQTQGGRALASNSYSYGGHFVHSLRLGTGAPISFTAGVSPESEFVCWQFYRAGESQPFLTVDKTRVDLHWTQAANAVARVVTRPKDEYKLLLETKVADPDDPDDPGDPDDPDDPDTPGHDCPGYVVVEEEQRVLGVVYHGPKRYYPRDAWVRLRPVANPGYRFAKWETAEDVTGITLEGLWWWSPPPPMAINGLEDERIAVRMQADTTITAVFEWDPIKVVQLAQGDLPEREIRQRDDPDTPDVREDVATISAAPAMPELRISLNGGRSDTPVEWRLKVDYKEGNRQDTFYVPEWNPSPGEAEEEDENAPRIQRIGNQTWAVDFRGEFVGGTATVYARFCDGQTARKTFRIWGYNPPRATVRNQLVSLRHRIAAYVESHFQQFRPDNRQFGGFLRTPETVLRATTDNGFGIMQLTNTPLPTVRQLWNWRANVAAGEAKLTGNAADAEHYNNQVRQGLDWDGRTGGEPPNEGVAFPDAPEFTDAEMDLEVWARYCAGYRYHDWDPGNANPEMGPVRPAQWVRRCVTSTNSSCHRADVRAEIRNNIAAGAYPPEWD